MARWNVGVVLVALTRLASAEGEKWDGTYSNEYGGSGVPLCPKGMPTIVVKGGKLSVTWTVSLGNGFVPLGRIEGVARDSGLVTTKVTLLEASKVSAILDKLGDKPANLEKTATELSFTFTGNAGGRALTIRGGNCGGRWENTDPLAEAPKAAAPKPAKAAKPPPPLAAGSAKWDTTYNAYASMTNDWRCPPTAALKNLVVKKGRFSIPWRLSSSFGEFVVGQLDGSIPAGGKVKLRPWVSVAELPPELAGKDRSLAALKSFAATMTFATSDGERGAKLEVGKACTYELNSVSLVTKKKSGGTSGGGTSTSSSSGSTSKTPAAGPRNKDGKGNGLPCTFNSDCATDNCEFHRCEKDDNFHRDYAKGAACEWSSECASGYCVDEKCR